MVVRRTLALALVVGLLALAVGALVVRLTFPSSDELQRKALQELGFDPAVLNSPIVKAIVDEISGRVEDRVVHEARVSGVEGSVAGAVVVLVGFGLIAADARRRNGAGSPPAEEAATPAAAGDGSP
jgi:hypothetical protein